MPESMSRYSRKGTSGSLAGYKRLHTYIYSAVRRLALSTTWQYFANRFEAFEKTRNNVESPRELCMIVESVNTFAWLAQREPHGDIVIG